MDVPHLRPSFGVIVHSPRHDLGDFLSDKAEHVLPISLVVLVEVIVVILELLRFKLQKPQRIILIVKLRCDVVLVSRRG